MSLRGRVAVIGIGETAHRRDWPGRTMWGIMAEAAIMAIQDAGIRKEDVDGIMTFGAIVYPAPIAEWLGINPKHFCSATANMGSSSANALLTAAALIDAGVCNYVLGVFGGQRDAALSNVPGTAGMSHEDRMGPSWDSEFGPSYGPTVAANNSYGWLYTRHMYEFGTRENALWNMAVNQRYNTMNNPRSAFRAAGTITMEDVGNSRFINYPLHILESVMPVAGASAYIVTSAERAKATRKPVYVLGAGFNQGSATAWVNPRLTLSPTLIAAQDAYQMAGLGPQDIQFTEFYDWYTILEAVCLEAAGVFGMKIGDIGPFMETVNTRFDGDCPMNTDGGQLSVGQLNPAGASSSQQICESVRQIRGEGESQVAKHDIGMWNA